MIRGFFLFSIALLISLSSVNMSFAMDDQDSNKAPLKRAKVEEQGDQNGNPIVVTAQPTFEFCSLPRALQDHIIVTYINGKTAREFYEVCKGGSAVVRRRGRFIATDTGQILLEGFVACMRANDLRSLRLLSFAGFYNPEIDLTDEVVAEVIRMCPSLTHVCFPREPMSIFHSVESILTACPSVKSFNIPQGRAVIGADLLKLVQTKGHQLEELMLNDSVYNNLQELAPHLTSLRRLESRDMEGWRPLPVSDADLTAVATHCQQIERVEIRGYHEARQGEYTHQGLGALVSKCCKLEKLDITYYAGNFDWIRSVSRNNNILSLCLDYTFINDQELLSLFEWCKKLEDLSLMQTKDLTGSWTKDLQSNLALKRLVWEINDEKDRYGIVRKGKKVQQVVSLAPHCSKLETLVFVDSEVSDSVLNNDFFSALGAHCTNLLYLDISCFNYPYMYKVPPVFFNGCSNLHTLVLPDGSFDFHWFPFFHENRFDKRQNRDEINILKTASNSMYALSQNSSGTLTSNR